MGRSMVRLGGAALLVALGLLWSSPVQAEPAAATFKTKCAICHSPDGSGSGPTGKALGVPDLRSDVVQKLSDADLLGVVTNGKNNKMPSYKDKLSADQIKDLVSVVRDLGKK
jgi:cytochrome c6